MRSVVMFHQQSLSQGPPSPSPLPLLLLVSRVGPHFLMVCEPDFNNVRYTDEYGHPIYVQDYTCLGIDKDELK